MKKYVCMLLMVFFVMFVSLSIAENEMKIISDYFNALGDIADSIDEDNSGDAIRALGNMYQALGGLAASTPEPTSTPVAEDYGSQFVFKRINGNNIKVHKVYVDAMDEIDAYIDEVCKQVSGIYEYFLNKLSNANDICSSTEEDRIYVIYQTNMFLDKLEKAFQSLSGN